MATQGAKRKITLKTASVILALVFTVVTVGAELFFRLGIISVSPAGELLNLFDADALDEEKEFVLFLNVGQGDCTIIKSRNMTAVIDFGVKDEDDTIYRTLLELGVDRVDLAVITHHHSDHLGGFIDLIQNMPVDNLLIGENSAKDLDAAPFNEVMQAAKQNNIKIYNPKAGGCFKIGDAKLQVLYVNETAEDENNRSIVSMLYIGGKKILFTGDGENEVEKYISENINIDCDILKMGHHGSYTSTTERLLNATTPTVAIASAGYDNIYNHPSKWALLRLENANVRLFRTDLNKNIRCDFNVDNNSFSITTEGG